MKNYEVTYDTTENYDGEGSFWKRQVVSAESYEEGLAVFHKEHPGNKVFSIDECLSGSVKNCPFGNVEE